MTVKAGSSFKWNISAAILQKCTSRCKYNNKGGMIHKSLNMKYFIIIATAHTLY
jgi:hypothetical protein